MEFHDWVRPRESIAALPRDRDATTAARDRQR